MNLWDQSRLHCKQVQSDDEWTELMSQAETDLQQKCAGCDAGGLSSTEFMTEEQLADNSVQLYFWWG